MMKQALHTILGATGAVGTAVIEALQTRAFQYRAVSRNANTSLPNHFKANLLMAEEADKAVEGSDYVYLCVGLTYSYKVWDRDWEIIMQNVIDACAKHQAKLIFLDNVYMYASPLPLPFDEQTAQNPPSKKGVVRKRVADMLLQAIEEKKVKALIARAADFYGKRATNSVLYISFLERIAQGKNPQLLSKGNVKHTFAYTTDIAKALLKLALCEECYGEVWHLPVGEAITMEEILQISNNYLGENHKIQLMPSLLKKVLPLFIPIIKEALEMQYQFEQTYMMSDAKFMQMFPNFKVTPYQTGVAEMIDWIKVNG